MPHQNESNQTCKCPACGGTARINEWEELSCGTLNSYRNLVCDCGYFEGDTGDSEECDYL